MHPRFLLVVPLLAIGACMQVNDKTLTAPFSAKVSSNLKPGTTSAPLSSGDPMPVGASQDAQGIQSDFVEGLILVRPKPGASLQEFLDRYEGTVVSDDTIPQAPPELGITLTDEQRKPTEFVVRINLNTVDPSQFEDQAQAKGLTGLMEFSSDGALRTLAGVADAVATGFDASADYISYGSQFPQTLLSTQERSNGAVPPVFNDAFTTTRFGTGGSQSNVTMAWQFISAHGIQRRVQVAVIDEGFWLNTNGTPRGTDTDFPANPAQYDFINNDYFADGPGIIGCGTGNPCFWHGTGSTGVATGIINNSAGAAGTGGLIGDPILLRRGGSRAVDNRAIRTAVAWGADVVSMSFGGDCNQGCRIYDREHTPINDAVDSGSRTVFLAAAGNGDSAGNGYGVGDDHFVHPCIEDHVICVGALNNDATTRINYSNFGDRVDVFAPTNIPVMSSPAGNDNNPAGPASPRSFGGTSAATPFAAGVAAMVKAINPNLTGDAVGALLRETAHPGAGDVTRFIDAYAAVKKAAEGIPAVNDRFEPNNDLKPTNLGVANSYSQMNLNMGEGRDVDYYTFSAPGAGVANIDVTYMQRLAAVNLIKINGDCGTPVYVSDSDLPGVGHRWQYRVAGGPVTIALKATDTTSYNLNVTFTMDNIPADTYEPNNTPATARYLYSFTFAGKSNIAGLQLTPRFIIDASLHSGDADYYIVRGVRSTLAESVFTVATPKLKVYDNDAPLTLELFEQNPDRTPGARLAIQSGGSCTPEPLEITLQSDVYYIVKITGGIGRYTLSNGIDLTLRKIPQLINPDWKIFVHPGDPIERFVRHPEVYRFPGDIAYSALNIDKLGLHMSLFDEAGSVMSEGVATAIGERLDLSRALAGQIYSLRIMPVVPQEQVARLEWEPASPLSESANLILNPGAEIVSTNDYLAVSRISSPVPGWQITAGKPRIYYYSDQNPDQLISASDAGPADRGLYLFNGDNHDGVPSNLRQIVTVDQSWRQIIDAGQARFRFGAYLGGVLDYTDSVQAKITFLGANQESLGQQTLGPVTALERGGLSGLLAQEASDIVPANTYQMQVDLIFDPGNGRVSRAFADNVELVLSSIDSQ